MSGSPSPSERGDADEPSQHESPKSLTADEQQERKQGEKDRRDIANPDSASKEKSKPTKKPTFKERGMHSITAHDDRHQYSSHRPCLSMRITKSLSSLFIVHIQWICLLMMHLVRRRTRRSLTYCFIYGCFCCTCGMSAMASDSL